MPKTFVTTDDQIDMESKKEKDKDRPIERPQSDPISEALGASFYLADKKLDYLRHERYSQRGDLISQEKFTFARWYPEQRVIIELFNRVTTQERDKVSLKAKTILAYNKKNPDKKIGYLPLQTSQYIDKEKFAEVKKGVVYDLPEAIKVETRPTLEVKIL